MFAGIVSISPSASAQSVFPLCSSAGSDADGDGWGWENNASCRVGASSGLVSTQSNNASGFPACSSSAFDPDGDGYGWENNQTCILSSGGNNGSTTSSPVAGSGNPVCSSSAFDPDGDGFGWENNQTCIVSGDSNGSPVVNPFNSFIAGPVSRFHRDGQTFLTWNETDKNDSYHVYRHSSPITSQNLGRAVKVTRRWGALDSDTSVNVYGGSNVPRNFVIDDLAAPLGDNTGLFVYTTQPGDSATAYYAVVPVDRNGNEQTNTVITFNTPVSESVATPSDVLTVSINRGKGRIYTQFMDYSNWNPTFNGYAYNYTVALPFNYNSSNSYPLMLELHAYLEVFKLIPESEFNWEVITLLPHDPGGSVGSLHSWWYGYARDHNYLTGGDVPRAGAIANFTEQRIMRAIDYVRSNRAFNIDSNRIHGYGNSMGASGVMSLALRYGSVLSGVYAHQPMTDYQNSSVFRQELIQLWGSRQDNLPIINGGPHSQGIQLYGLSGVRNVGVWDWMDHHRQMVERRGEDFAYLMTYHGKQDQIIEWPSQGRPTVQALTDAAAGFSARHGGSVGHTWIGFAAVNTSLFGFGNGDDFTWKYPLNLSFPGIQNASGSSAVNPSNSGNDTYNLNIEWATPHTPFASNIVDLPGRYEISVRSTSGAQRADITPRRTQRFNPNLGSRCSWTARNNATNRITGSGTVTVDDDSLVTVTGAEISTGSGTLIAISCP